ncbi:MAG: glycoside hydrolase family 3 N-terminal domain-containing protein [Actinomycetaceae bacterium]|nr:glycoside hydrolase family 3 N-terminal domain-containing protein [Actinomycetaceae bacterium]
MRADTLTPDQLAQIDSLIEAMTWEEKLNQIQVTFKMSQEECLEAARSGIGALFWPGSARDTNALQKAAIEESAHGIPLLIGLDVIHGFRTIFPTPLAMAASFAPKLAQASARASAEEARSNGVNWTFSPMVDTSRDPRWGRVVEGFGEDPLVNSAFGAAMVRGYQGEKLDSSSLMAACAKHYVGYGAAEGGRDYNTVDMSTRRLRDVYLPPFRQCVEAGAATVMASFNTMNGRPMHAHKALLTEVLKEEYGFEGFIVGDASGVENLIPHGVAANMEQAAIMSLSAGLDMEMGGKLYEDGHALLTEPDPALVERVNEACRRVLGVKFALGLFDNPYIPEDAEILEPREDHRATARQMAEQCPVLLTNNGTLPVAPTFSGKILLAGPAADSRDHLGAWVQRMGVEPEVSLKDTLAAALPQAQITVRAHENPLAISDEDIAEIRGCAADYDLILLALSEPSDLSGEASSRADIRLPGNQDRLVEAACESDTPVVVVLVNGRPLDISAWAHLPAAILEAWHLGITGPEVIADILTGHINPSGRLPMAFPRSVGQLPAAYDARENTGRPPSRAGSIEPKNFDFAVDGPTNIAEFFTSKYRDLDLGPLFPFGHGLSYSPITVEKVQVRTPTLAIAEMNKGACIQVEVTLTNEGDVPADYSLLVFTHDILSSLAPAVRRLAAFVKVGIPAGGTIHETVDIPASALAFWEESTGAPVIEAGEFEVLIEGDPNQEPPRFTLV